MSARITAEPIDAGALLAGGTPGDAGAVLVFLGTVRDHNDGRRVTGMRYEAYADMALGALTEIVAEARARSGSDHITAVHRIGELAIGDVSVAIVVATPHRADAYEASRYIIEEIKRRLPVWKHEHYADGAGRWLDGQLPDPSRAAGHG
jgi:molybdopterin synthase catalytic subunit